MNYKNKVVYTLLTLVCILFFIIFKYLSIYLDDVKRYNQNPVNFKMPFTVVPDIPENSVTIVSHSNKEKIVMCSLDNECYKLAEVLVYEARGESLQGMYAVANVVMNRVQHPKFPDTIKEVVHQRYQFSYLLDKHRQSKPSKQDWNRAYIVAFNTINNIVKPVAPKSLFYLNPKSLQKLPRWAMVYKYRMTIGNHVFYSFN
tara:strand:+ start:81425 stop:82027 length:603 start_codon:yes stop_codon:yes gene_type:complete